MRRISITVVSGAAACLLLSGCFGLQSFSWSPRVATPGKRVTAKVVVAPLNLPGPPGPGSHHRDYPFTVIGLDASGDLSLATDSIWDAKGSFNGPKPLIPDSGFLNYLFTSGRCDITDNGSNTVPLDSQAYDWHLLRTEAPVSDKGKITKTSLEKINLKVAKSAPPLAVVQEVFLTGAWYDGNGNGVGDNSDSIGCNGHIETSLPIKAK